MSCLLSFDVTRFNEAVESLITLSQIALAAGLFQLQDNPGRHLPSHVEMNPHLITLDLI